jgi:hypothetical protein
MRHMGGTARSKKCDDERGTHQPHRSVYVGRGAGKWRIAKSKVAVKVRACTLYIYFGFLASRKWKPRTQSPFTSIDILTTLQHFPTFSTPARSKMLHKSRFGDDPFSASLPETPPSTAVKWANRVARPSRFSGLRLTRLRTGILLLLTGSFVLIHDWIPKLATSRVSCGTTISEASLLTSTASAHYRHRQHDNCFPSCLPTSRARSIPSSRHHRHVPVLQVPQCLQCLLSRSACAFQSSVSGSRLNAHCNVIRRSNWA